MKVDNDIIMSTIRPVDAKIYLEDGIPYIDYVGVVDTSSGTFKVHIPKLSLEFEKITVERETYEYVYDNNKTPLCAMFRQLFYVTNNCAYTLEVIERTMTKEQIEKELGYKVKICED